MNIGIILSSGGAAVEAVANILGTQEEFRFVFLTDRPCGAEMVATRIGAEAIRISEPDRQLFSCRAAEILIERGISNCLLFFERLVSQALFDSVETFNIHPSILPAFPGKTCLEDARARRVRVIGCSLHRVDASVDGGPLVAQIACGADPNAPIDDWNRRTYAMKVFLTLVFLGLTTGVTPSERPVNASHGLRDDWYGRFLAFQDALDLRVI